MNTRLHIILDKEIESLSDFEREALLIVGFTIASDSVNGSSVSINFTDYNNRRPIATCSGQDIFRYGQPGINKATDDAIKQVLLLFTN